MTADTPEQARHIAHSVNRLERGRALADDEIACYIADHQTALRHGTASVGDEIAAQLLDRLAPLDVEGEGIIQRSHVPCCWCGEHHEEGE